jgi:hypothetical protein
VWRKGQCSGPRGHPACVRDSLQIWSSGQKERSFRTTRMKSSDVGQVERTFVELDAEIRLDVNFYTSMSPVCGEWNWLRTCGEIVLMKLRVYYVSERRGTDEGTREGDRHGRTRLRLTFLLTNV